MAPIKTFQIRKKYAPWLSPDLKNEMKARDIAQQAAQESRSQEDWKKYKKLRNFQNFLQTVDLPGNILEPG